MLAMLYAEDGKQSEQAQSAARSSALHLDLSKYFAMAVKRWADLLRTDSNLNVNSKCDMSDHGEAYCN